MKPQMSNMEFGRRLATERDLEKSEVFNLCNIGMHVQQAVSCSFIMTRLHYLFIVAGV